MTNTRPDITPELSRCLSCRAKPCEKACPLNVSPCDFIKAAKAGDYQTAAFLIANKNPLAQTCGLVCPDRFCQAACIRKKIDRSIEIPCLQAQIIHLAGMPPLELTAKNTKTIAVVGGGPAGLGAVFELIRNGYNIALFEKSSLLGGAARLIPEHRLKKAVLDAEIRRLVANDRVTLHLNTEITDFESLKQEYDSLILALGEQTPRTLGIKGEEHCTPYARFLAAPSCSSGCKKTAVIGGGEVALDCALSASGRVEMFVRRRRGDMRIMARHQKELDQKNILIRELTSITEITARGTASYCLKTVKNQIDANGRAAPLPETGETLEGYDEIITALGSYCPGRSLSENFITAGDMTARSGTVVEALASGINAAKRAIKELETSQTHTR